MQSPCQVRKCIDETLAKIIGIQNLFLIRMHFLLVEKRRLLMRLLNVTNLLTYKFAKLNWNLFVTGARLSGKSLYAL